VLNRKTFQLLCVFKRKDDPATAQKQLIRFSFFVFPALPFIAVDTPGKGL